jgi:cyclopropane fatty-acyl-phospholipid synthase-like methyltransferase
MTSLQAERHALVGPTDHWEMQRDFQFTLLKQMGLKPHHTYLDLGCGTLRGGVPIIDYLETGNYAGFEVRPAVLEEGKAELKEAGLEHKQPVLISFDDIKKLNLDNKFDFIGAFYVVIHLTDEILADFFAKVSECLKADGVFYANINIVDGGAERESNWAGFPVMWRSIDYYQSACQKAGLKMEVLGLTHELMGGPTGFDRHDNRPIVKFMLA